MTLVTETRGQTRLTYSVDRIGMPNSPVCIVAMALLALFVPRARSQQQPAKDIAPAIQVEVKVVDVMATVRDKHGALVNTLTKDDFILTEDSQTQQIKYFARETDLPLTIGLLVDVSYSQRNLIDAEREAAYQFFSRVLRKEDKAFLVSFAADAELLQDFTGSPRLLQMALERLQVTYSTVLYDAVHVAARDRLMRELGRKIMVLVTDGIDAGSRRTLEDAVKAAQQANTVIYTICYLDLSAYSYNLGSFGGADRAVREMSEDTGGRVFRVDKNHSLEKVFDELQQEMRSQYSIGYTSTNEKRDGSYRHVSLRTRDHSLKVQARKGYYAMPPEK